MQTPSKTGILIARWVLAALIALIAIGAVKHGFSAEVLQRIWQNMLDRPGGSMNFRFLLQPVMATLAAMRDGIGDARTGRAPFLSTILRDPAQRKGRLHEAVVSTARIILLGLCMDGIYQFVEFDTFHPAEAVVIALLLAFVPYALLRGPLTRVAAWWLRTRSQDQPGAGTVANPGPFRQLGAALRKAAPEPGHLSSDLAAGLTFAVVNVPQAMAHALLAAVNPVLGIYTLMVAVPVGAIFTSSIFMNVSSTAATSVAAGVVLADVPADVKVEALATLVLLVGILQFLAGLLRLGFVIRFVSNAVMTGFLNGVALLIILGQLGDLTGYRSAFGNRVAQALDLLLRLSQVHIPSTMIGAFALALIVLLLQTPWRRFAFIIAIALATGLLAVLTLPSLPTAAHFASVSQVGHIVGIPRSLPQLAPPAPTLVWPLLLPAFSVALIGLIQGAGVSQGTPNPNGRYPDVSRDFLGQGLANIATSAVAGIPAGGSISGTALIMGAGAKSRWTNIVAGLFVAIIVLVAAPAVERVPMPALAALLIVAGFQGLRLQQAVVVWETGKVSAAVMLATFAATLLVPLQDAVLVGIALSLVLHVVRQSNKVVVTQWVLQPDGFPLEQPPPKTLPSHQLTLLHIYGSLFFAAAKNIEEKLPEASGSTHAVVAINLRGRSEIGSTFLAVLDNYSRLLQNRRGKLMLVGVDPCVRDQLARTGVIEAIGEENIFMATPQIGTALNEAVAAARAWLDQASMAEGCGDSG
jgi:SulP family sulfate permease